MPLKKRPRPSTGQMLLTKMLGRKELEETDGSSVDLVQTAGTSVDPPIASTSTSTVSSATSFALSAVDEEKKESTT
ncbi:hypothetical protein BaRGS_00018809 [Batillaria attramentaria]|uniref:Uncharacterized protein n=1 Tax=Batillaria attramentaria TaxID=370345 RepID=A0ABD0KRW2_9CAEN